VWPTSQAPPTVLIVDRDVAFTWWLGEMFAEAGSHVIPAVNCTQAVSLVRKLEMTVELIVVNPNLRGVSQMIRTLRQLNRSMKVVAITDGEASAAASIQADTTLQRPSGWEPISRPDWLDRVHRILRAARTPGGA